jgi:predicted Zn-dependent protease
VGAAAARLAAGGQRRPALIGGGLLVLAALLGWATHQGGWYLWTRGQFLDAQDALARHDWTEARLRLEAARRGWPNDPAVYLLAARASRRLEHLDEAEGHLDTCERLQGGPSHATEVERALLRVHRGDLAGAEPFLRTCLAQDDPDSVEILDVLSAALLLNYRVAEAHRLLDELLRRQPDNFDALVARGWTAENQAWYPLAVESLEKALALRPESDKVRLSLAEIQVVLGRYDDAQGHFEQLRRRRPKDAAVLFGLARSLAGRGQKAEALRLLDGLLADHPDDWKALGERGWLYVQLDRPADGEPDLRRAYALAPPDLPLVVRLADCLRLEGKKDEADVFRHKADRLQADIARAGELGDLIRDKKPDDPALRHELACILLRLGKQQDALHWFQTALDKDPAYRPTHEKLAEFYRQVGALEQAAYHQRFAGGPGGAHPGGSAP